MFSALFLVVAGLVVLVIGGEALLRGAVRLALYYNVTPAVVGLTVVAAGTSVPELAVSLLSALEGKADIAVGNVVGSNIFNITIVLGVSALIQTLRLSGNAIKLEYPVLVIVTLMCLALCHDGALNWLDGALLITIYVAFTIYVVSLVKEKLQREESVELDHEVKELASSTPGALAPSLGLTALGIALLAYGADLTVEGAVELARIFGISERIIGLTIVSIGTSLPEVVTSVVSAYRGRDDVAIANVIGSNLFNILIILGLSAVVSPISVSSTIINYDNWWMLFVTLGMFPLLRSGFCIDAREGKILLGVYSAYLLSLIFAG